MKMEFLMDILRAIASLRVPAFDLIFSLITMMGEETFFLIFAIIFLWCVDKREGYYILFVGLFGIVINQFLKMLFRIPRPWVYDPSFKPVDSAIEAATGYSFPSGHTQNIAGTLGAVAAYNRRRWVTVTSVAVILLVGFSRMYLGVHTLLDVGVSLIVGLVVVLALRYPFSTEERFRRFMPILSLVGILFAAAYVIYVHLVSSDPMLDADNLNSAMKNAYTMIGCLAGLLPVYFIDLKIVRFDTRAVWYVQLIKLIVGFAVVMLFKVGLSSPLVALFGNEYVARAVRYFIIVIFAGLLWPMCFGYLSRIRIAALDSLGAKASARIKGR